MDISAIQAIVTGSNTLVTWTLAIVGASLLALLSTSYVRPLNKWSKLTYLIYIPGWLYSALTIYWGDSISRRGIMAAVRPNLILQIETIMNDEYVKQRNNFNVATSLFGCWLVFYLLSWVFADFINKNQK